MKATYTGDRLTAELRLVADGEHEIHGYMTKPMPVAPVRSMCRARRGGWDVGARMNADAGRGRRARDAGGESANSEIAAFSD